MGTRSNTVIPVGYDAQTILYRHNDGNPGFAGASLLQALIDVIQAEGNTPHIGTDVLVKMLDYWYDATDYRPKQRVYEVTDGLAGDGEYIYRLRYVKGGVDYTKQNGSLLPHYKGHWEIGMTAIAIEDEGKPEWLAEEAAEWFTLEAFTELVNQDRKATNRFLASLRETDSLYANLPVYPMIELPDHLRDPEPQAVTVTIRGTEVMRLSEKVIAITSNPNNWKHDTLTRAARVETSEVLGEFVSLSDGKSTPRTTAKRLPPVKLTSPYPDDQQQFDFSAEVVKNESVRLFGTWNKWQQGERRMAITAVPVDRTFKIGDVVEYDSYNFAYTGKIVAIGEKTITIDKGDGYSKKCRLTLMEFARRNHDLDLAKIADERANWYD